MAFNLRGAYGADVRRAFTGKDAIILDEDGALMATVDNFQAQVDFTNASYNPLGSAITQEHMATFGITITISYVTVEDDKFIRDVFEWFHRHRHAPMWTLQSVVFGYNGTESRFIYRDCVPSGNWDL